MYEMCYIVLIYGFLGWCTEVVYAAVTKGKFVNRGFLNGPICPIYGFGMLAVLKALDFAKDNVVLLFFGGMILTSLLEFLTGLILEKLFGAKWWDYSKTPFNICGYVCLKFSILWGFAVVFVVKIVNRPIEKLLSIEPNALSITVLAILLALFAADIILTIFGILKLPAKLRGMEEIEFMLKKTSDSIGQKLFKGTEAAETSYEKVQKNIEAKKQEFEVTKANAEEKYKELVKSDNFVSRRILKAFPNLEIKRINVKKLLKKNSK